jgi:HSP20 family protein
MSEDRFERWWRKRRFPFFLDPFRSVFEIDEYFKEVEKMFEEMFKEVQTQVPRELVREKKLPSGGFVREIGPFVYGYSITIGPDGKPKIREFGNVRPKLAPKPEVKISQQREPLVDVIEEENAIKVIAELPGINKEDINLECVDKMLRISAQSAERKYYKEVELPTEVEAESAKASYKNGILEVIIKKKEGVKEKGKSIKIE